VERDKIKPVNNELNHDFLRGKVSFPEDIPSMLTLLANYRGGKVFNYTVEAILDGMTLVQDAGKPWKKATCTHCGSKQYKAAKCVPLWQLNR
jgi:hypothetical protein